MTPPVTAPRLSAVRLVSFVTEARDAVRVGLLSSDAASIHDLAPVGIGDALDAVAALPLLRQTAGAIVHGGGGHAFDVARVHLVAPVPMVRAVVAADGDGEPTFADPATVHGPGGHCARPDAASVRLGLGVVLAARVDASATADAGQVRDALGATTLVLGWARAGADGVPQVLPGAIGPYLAAPCREPDVLHCTLVAPLMTGAAIGDDVHLTTAAPRIDDFVTLACRAARSHTLQAGDLLVIFPARPDVAHPPPSAGSWIRGSAPGLGTLSIAVR